jgi:hypothetical protein
VMREMRELLLPRIDSLPNQMNSRPLEIMAAVLDGVTDPRNKRDKRSKTKRNKGSASNPIWYPGIAHGTSISP